jgi:hypothetical protein
MISVFGDDKPIPGKQKASGKSARDKASRQGKLSKKPKKKATAHSGKRKAAS